VTSTVHLSRSEEETRAAGRDLAPLLRRGDVVLLSGDLGSGKTVFVRGLAEGLGADPDEVASPTFALVHEYGPDGEPPRLVHADLYRLMGETADAPDLGLEEARAAGAVVAIEWPRAPFTELPAWRVALTERDDSSREITIDLAGPGRGSGNPGSGSP
jgi:tRNA threonylcarbamoyladenosine biosynthesis protein TsaE